jgi:iron complex transport system substrate-binding protein
LKIVSLLPAATEIVCALGLRDQLVARSHECDFPAGVEALPALTRARVDSSLPSAEIDEQVRRVVGSRLPIYVLDEARLAALAPDVVITQAACEVCAIPYEQVESALRRTSVDAQVLSLSPTRLDHILEDVRRVAGACGAVERGETLVEDLRHRLKGATARAAGRLRVAVIEWLAPPMLAGHWVPDAVQAAGGIPVGPEPGQPSPYTTWSDVNALRPDAVLVAPCGFDLARTLRESAPFADTLRTLAPRVLLLDGNAYLNRPGPRIVEAVETIAGWLAAGFVPIDGGTDLATAFPTGEQPRTRPEGRDSGPNGVDSSAFRGSGVVPERSGPGTHRALQTSGSNGGPGRKNRT